MGESPQEVCKIEQRQRIAGLFLMPLRWVCAWIMFSAAWRRLVLKPESLIPTSPEYEGFKLGHFLPKADLLSPALAYIIQHATLLQIFLYVFTGLELCLGIFLLLGFCSRLSGLVLFVLFTSLMLVAGWLGTTCLDEWTVASFGMGLGISLFLAGGGPYALDAYLYDTYGRSDAHPGIAWLLFPEQIFIHNYRQCRWLGMILSIFMLTFVLYTNQYFVGGVYGPFHNPAVKPELVLQAELSQHGKLDLHIYRDQGPDTYGAFVTEIKVVDAQGQTVMDFDANRLGKLPNSQIDNHNLLKVKADGYALVVPLGAKATVHLAPDSALHLPQGSYQIIVTDVSGLSWKTVTTNRISKP